MFRSIVMAVCWSLAVSVAAAASEPYDGMVARLKSGDAAVDYRALRDAYAESAGYQPYGATRDELKRALHDAFNAQDCPKVLIDADRVLNEIYIDIEAHLLSARCFERGGEQAKAGFHRAVAKGLMDSIVASGDGKTPKTAFVVVAIDEEYAVLSALRWRLVEQALIDDDGHSFDRMSVKSANSDETTVLFFQIDRPMKWLSHSLSP